MDSEEASVSSSSSNSINDIEGFKKFEMKNRRKKLRLRKQLDKQHIRIQNIDAKQITNSNISENQGQHEETKTAVLNEFKDKKRSFKGKYDLDLNPNKQYTKADLEIYSLPDLSFRLTLYEQNCLLKQMLKIPEDADIGEIKAKIKTAYQLREEKKRAVVYSTGIQELDEMFNFKGISSGEIIEFCGLNGMGKSLMVMTILINILANCECEEVVYFDTRNGFHAKKLILLMESRVFNEEQKASIVSRIKIIRTTSVSEIINYLQQLIEPESVDKALANKNVRFLVIDSITHPFFRTSFTSNLNKMLITIFHSVLKQLSRKGYIIITTNLGLHKYKISESDIGDNAENEENNENIADDECMSEKASQSITGETNEDLLTFVKPALESSNWKDILDYRFVINASEMHPNILGFIESARTVTLANSSKTKSFKIDFDELGYTKSE